MDQLSGQEPIAQSPLVHAMVADLKNSLAKPKAKKETVTVDMLSAIMHSMGVPPSLSDLRLAVCWHSPLSYAMMDWQSCDVVISHSQSQA